MSNNSTTNAVCDRQIEQIWVSPAESVNTFQRHNYNLLMDAATDGNMELLKLLEV